MKRVYVAHSTGFDFRKELYEPLRKLASEFSFTFPHDTSDEQFDSLKFLQSGCDVVVAEVSYPSTGLGIELGWANMLKIPIICIFRKGSKPSSALRAISTIFVEYDEPVDLVRKLTSVLGNASLS